MGEKNNSENLSEGTFGEIPREEFFINQNNKVDSFGICPSCEENTLDLENRVCKCGYSLDHDYSKNIEDVVDNILDKTNNSLNYSICSCGNRMGLKSVMCKECYWKNKLNGNI